MISLNSHAGTVASEPQKPTSNEKPNSIFGQSLEDKTRDKKKVKYLADKEKKKAYVSLGVSFLFLAVYSVFFFYENTAAYLKAPGKISTINEQITTYDELTLPSLEKARNLHKTAYDKEFEEVITALETVFPVGIDKLGIIQLLETFSVEVSTNFPPFELTSINIRQSQERDGYQVTTVSTSIHSSLAGFDRFLTLVDRSGDIYQTTASGDRVLLDRMVRLMSVSDVSISYRGINEETGRDDGVDFNVTLDFYSRMVQVNQ